MDYRGARFYDADIGRFLSLDPYAMDYPSVSDYSYVLDNPLFFTDPDGRSVDWIRNADDNGTITYEAEAGDSAWSLYTQYGSTDGFTAEQANNLVVGILGENYIGSDGGLKSNVEVGDVLTIFTEQELTDKELPAEGAIVADPEPKESKIPDFGLWGDVTGANQVMRDMDYALDVYEAEGINSYINAQIGIAHKEIAQGSTARGLRNRLHTSKVRKYIGRARTTNRRGKSTTDLAVKPSASAGPPTVTVSGQKRRVHTESRGGKYYINKNGNKTYLNSDGTKRN